MFINQINKNNSFYVFNKHQYLNNGQIYLKLKIILFLILLKPIKQI